MQDAEFSDTNDRIFGAVWYGTCCEMWDSIHEEGVRICFLRWSDGMWLDIKCISDKIEGGELMSTMLSLERTPMINPCGYRGLIGTYNRIQIFKLPKTGRLITLSIHSMLSIGPSWARGTCAFQISRFVSRELVP